MPAQAGIRLVSAANTEGSRFARWGTNDATLPVVDLGGQTMARVTLIVTALVIALVSVFAGTTAAQTDTRDRTFLTFSGAVEMPGVTLPAGTYVFKLADTP